MASSARLDELKKKFDENPRRYFAPLANEHRKSGDLDQAIALCRTHLPQQPGHISGHIVLAQALFEAGSLEESREIFHSALGLDPENLIALRYLGDIAKEASDLVTARQWYERVLEVDPRNEEIAQLVRDLDAPRSAAEERAEPIEVEDPSAAASPPTAFAAPPAPTTPEDDARFAPLSLDDLDVDETTSTAAPNEPAAAAPGAWDAPADASDLSMLDTGIDPFDLDPAGSVDALLEGHDPAATEDFFLTELSGATAPIDAAEPEAAASEEDLGRWAPPMSAAPNAPETPAGSDAALDEGEFYLEPPPPEPETVTAATEDAAPVASSADTRPVDDRDQVSMPGLDAFAAEYSLPDADALSAAPAMPNADALAQFAAQETAEWQPPDPEPAHPASQTADSDLGLEVMEFVPPSREPAAAPVATYTQDSSGDPFSGRTLDTPTADAGAAPAAFVTETMAELYLQQGFRNEALGVYRELLARNPSDASLRERIEQIESGSLSSIGMAAVSENVVESAIKRHSARPARSVRSFFASLAGRRAPVHRDAAEPTTGGEADIEQDAPAAEWPPQIEADTRAGDIAPPSYETTPASDEGATPPMSAAETLANFDPFAEPDESSVAPIDASSLAPNEADAELGTDPMAEFDAADLSAWGAPTLELPTPAMPAVEPPVSETPATELATIESPESEAPSPTAGEEAPPSHRSLEDLFPETPVAPRAEAAAQTFATAFGRSEPQGRPTRAASNELSLDHVFRGAPEGAPSADGGFSFDQFFSDSRSSGGDTSAPATTAHETGHNGGSGDAHDIEQFTAWLEGLKKK